jgi:ATP-dependent DNA helicase RecG
MTTLDSAIAYLKGVGPKRGEMLNKELSIFTFRDLLFHFPHRYVDKTQFYDIRSLNEYSGEVQLRGVLRRLSTIGEGRKKRLVGRFRDNTGVIELVWFTGAHWLEKQLEVGKEYIIYGRVNAFKGKLSMPHPEMEQVKDQQVITKAATFAPVYHSTEKLNSKGLDAKGRRRIMTALFEKITPADTPENLPAYLIQKFKFPSRFEALKHIHFPKTQEQLTQATNRLKFEELFFLQLRLLQIRRRRKDNIRGFTFSKIGDHFNTFYYTKLPFELTGAQKRVLKEVRRDLGQGIQMNRLLQGDVGSGKTIVGLMCMLIALDNGFQACLMGTY